MGGEQKAPPEPARPVENVAPEKANVVATSVEAGNALGGPVARRKRDDKRASVPGLGL